MRVLYRGLNHHSPTVETRLGAIDGIELVATDDDAAMLAAAGTVDVMVTTPNYYSEAIEQAVVSAGRLRLLQLLSAGYDSLVGRRFPPAMIAATAGDSLGSAVAEHALALALAVLRRIDVAHANQLRETWDRAPYATVGSLEGKTAAIVGFGAIGAAIGARLQAFGTTVIGVSHRGEPRAGADESQPVAALEAVLARADLVFIALPATAETEGLFDAHLLGRIKPGALLVNIARGRIVDTGALVAALEAGALGGAGLDVTDPEPLPAGHPLWHAPNTVITPHYGGVGGQVRSAAFVAANLERLRRGEPLVSVVDLSGS